MCDHCQDTGCPYYAPGQPCWFQLHDPYGDDPFEGEDPFDPGWPDD